MEFWPTTCDKQIKKIYSLVYFFANEGSLSNGSSSKRFIISKNELYFLLLMAQILNA